jgi:hypothetical protein
LFPVALAKVDHFYRPLAFIRQPTDYGEAGWGCGLGGGLGRGLGVGFRLGVGVGLGVAVGVGVGVGVAVGVAVGVDVAVGSIAWVVRKLPSSALSIAYSVTTLSLT